ncbi:hypothetical protein B1748_23615 [Paenibacillus sp. MY03]|uniref:ClpX C4-type zinc finger protein n=1 Tax=Paenibacillus sp. MY03 TaxID=302980 RepID=UPI000B3D39F2|nr:ClpX C4-type zinc finger protein [Paenibacillus sp. MY03]OUS73000.1 hypothetical protein B1748_23615 [Paenibacillus sp. MY03]
MDVNAIYVIVDKAMKYDELAFLNKTKEVSCSFCGKSQSSVERMIASKSANICNECVLECCEILAEGDPEGTELAEGERSTE